jgi:glycosyltransferase involved in cell wall biosynthesis
MSACTVGGAEAHVLALLGGLDPARYELWLGYFEERPDEARPMLEDFRALGVRTVDLRGRGQLDPAAVLRLAQLLRRQRFDLVHTHSLRAEVAAVVAATLGHPRPRLIRSVHNTDDFYQRPPASWLARLTSARLDRVVAISDAVAEHVQRYGRVPAGKVRRIYYGLDLKRYGEVKPLGGVVSLPRGAAPLPPNNGGFPVSATDENPPLLGGRGADLGSQTPSPTIGMIARLAPQKGHTVLLEALPAVVARFPGLRVELVGHEHLTSRAELEARAARLGLSERVHFAGFRDDLPALLARWDLLVLPSLWEGFGLVLLEAMAAGRPVVASRVGPIPEVVVHGETGLLVPPGQPAALAAALLELLEHPDLAARLGEAGQRRAAERFGLDRMVAETEALYDELLGPIGSAIGVGAVARPNPGAASPVADNGPLSRPNGGTV